MILKWKDATRLPVEANGLTPDAILGRAPGEVSNDTVRVGNQAATLGDVFTANDDGEDCLTLEGDMRGVRGIGRGMASGCLKVRGNAGPHFGATMSGGHAEVFGDADDYAGAEMRGGLLRIHGDAGRCLGASYPGNRLGMRDGVILVDGNVGGEAGRSMRRGLIAVGGNAGECAGRGMVAGSLFVFGTPGRYAGLGLKRGTIAAFGGDPFEILPGFAPSGRYRFPFLTLYLRQLAAWGFDVPAEVFSAEVLRYNGDLADGGKGEILVRGGSD